MEINGITLISLGNGPKKVLYSFNNEVFMHRFEKSCYIRSEYDVRVKELLERYTVLLSNNGYFPHDVSLCVEFNEKKLGIYAFGHGRPKQIAKRAEIMTGLPMFGLDIELERAYPYIQIGVGTTSDINDMFFWLKDLLYALPLWV